MSDPRRTVSETIVPGTVITGPESYDPSAVTGPVFSHLIHFKLFPGTAQATIDEAFRLMVAMCNTAGVVRFRLVHSLDTRKGTILLEDIDFVDEAAFEVFKKTKAHTAYAEFIRDYADWTIVDFVA